MSSPRALRDWLLIANLIAGLVLWFGYLTDVSFAGNAADYVFPVLVFVLAVVTLARRRGRMTGPRTKRDTWLACLPSIIGGGAGLALFVVMLVTPLMLVLGFWADEVMNEKHIQSATSPSGLQVADVYFRGVGAYTSGNGRILVRVRPRWFPLIERDVYQFDPSYADEQTTHYLRWDGEGQLIMFGEPNAKESSVELGIIRPAVPEIIRLPLALLG